MIRFRFIFLTLLGAIFIAFCGANLEKGERPAEKPHYAYLSTRKHVSLLATKQDFHPFELPILQEFKIIQKPVKTKVNYLTGNRYVITDLYGVDTNYSEEHFFTIRLCKKQKGRFVTLDSLFQYTGYFTEEPRFPAFYGRPDLFSYRTSDDGSSSSSVYTTFILIADDHFTEIAALETDTYFADPETTPQTAYLYDVKEFKVEGDQLIVPSNFSNVFMGELNSKGEYPLEYIDKLTDITVFRIDKKRKKLVYVSSSNYLYSVNRWGKDVSELAPAELSWELFDVYYKKNPTRKPKSRF